MRQLCKRCRKPLQDAGARRTFDLTTLRDALEHSRRPDPRFPECEIHYRFGYLQAAIAAVVSRAEHCWSCARIVQDELTQPESKSA